MAQWVKICGLEEAPAEGKVIEVQAGEFSICLANVNGELSALDNWCPHRRGPLGQGWIEGKAVVCPWHSWAFDVRTGRAEYPEEERVDTFSVKTEAGDVFVDIT